MAKCCSGPIASALIGRKADLLIEGEGENSEICANPAVSEESDVCDGRISDIWDVFGCSTVDC